MSLADGYTCTQCDSHLDDLALGYRSPSHYLHAEFDGVLAGLDAATRRLAV